MEISLAIVNAFRDELEGRHAGWSVRQTAITGPAGATVELSRGRHSDNPAHLDVRCTIPAAGRGHPGLWDCVVGFGASDEDIGRTAAHLWGCTTASAFLELQYSGCGEYADHYRGWETEGLRGWHAIAGGILGYGEVEHAQRLQRWWLEHPFLPVVAGALAGDLDERAAPHGMKILLGGRDVAEVTLDGTAHEDASLVLGALDWPRLAPPAFVRSYVIALHRERG